MNKDKIFDVLLNQLRESLGEAVRSSKDAASYATSNEAKAESKYDTQGLEASYLAAGQAGRAEETGLAIQKLQSLREVLTGAKEEGGLGALVECDWGGVVEFLFFSPIGGGEEILVEGTEVTVVNPATDLGRALAGKGRGERFTLPNGNGGVVVAVS